MQQLADSHIHLYPPGAEVAPGDSDLAVYDRLRATHNIECAVAIGFEGRTERHGDNAYLAAVASQLPWLAPLAYLPTTSSPTAATLHALPRQGFLGVAVWARSPEQVTQLLQWTPASIRAVSQVPVVSINATPSALAQLSEFVTALGPASVLISHLGLPGRFAHRPTAGGARHRIAPLLGLAGAPHVGVKLSGLHAICDPPTTYPHHQAAPFVDSVLDSFGPDRLYWGSDFPPSRVAASFAHTIDLALLADLSQGELDRVMHGNLVELIATARTAWLPAPAPAHPPDDTETRTT